MELELGLAPPTQSPIIGFDLNKKSEPKEMVRNDYPFESKSFGKNKRNFAETFEHGGVSTESWPLLLWNGQPNEDEEWRGQKKRTFGDSNKSCEEENHLLGWPPIKSWMKNLLHGHQGGRIAYHRTTERGQGGTKSMYVKVKMEGEGIGRKIDLRLYHSYQTLKMSLINMFVKHPKSDKDGARYILFYQDREGDWLLAADVPWQKFIESVQRMEIVRNAS